jgi:hypothetical protein
VFGIVAEYWCFPGRWGIALGKAAGAMVLLWFDSLVLCDDPLHTYGLQYGVW